MEEDVIPSWTPVVGMRVIVVDNSHCEGYFEDGTIGYIKKIHSLNSFTVYDGKDYWWYCRRCVSPVED